MIFVDASALISVWDHDNINHKQALNKSIELKKTKQQLSSSNIIIGEVLTVLSMQVNKKKALEFGKEIEKSNLIINFINQDLHQKAWEIFQKIKGKNVSFFDCASFAVMEDLGIKKAFSFDKDFKKYGFELV